MAMVIVLAAVFMAWIVNHRPPPVIEGPYPVNAPEADA
jgi:hypothetical protein